MKPNPQIALIYHYDLARALNGEPVDWQAIPVNVDAGREGGDLCRAAADFGKRRDLFAMPAPTIAAPAAPPVVAVEQPAVDPEPATASGVVPVSAATRERLRARVRDLVGSHIASEELLRLYWPQGVPTLKHQGHTPDQLAQILVAVRRVETEIGATWHEDDAAPRRSRLAIQRALDAWADRPLNDAWFHAALIATHAQCMDADATLEGLVGTFTIEQADRLADAAQAATNQ